MTRGASGVPVIDYNRAWLRSRTPLSDRSERRAGEPAESPVVPLGGVVPIAIRRVLTASRRGDSSRRKAASLLALSVVATLFLSGCGYSGHHL